MWLTGQRRTAGAFISTQAGGIVWVLKLSSHILNHAFLLLEVVKSCPLIGITILYFHFLFINCAFLLNELTFARVFL